MPKKVSKTPKKAQKEKCYLQEAELSILRELQIEWNKQPDKKARDAFVKGTVLPKIQELNKDKYGPDKISKCKESKKLWETRMKAIFVWFNNHKPYKDKAVFKVERKLTLRWVVGRVKAAEVEALIKATYPEVERGDRSYPGHYQKCLSAYIQSLGEEEKAALEEQKNRWQKDGPPTELRTKAAKKYSRKAIANMHTVLHKEMNVHCLTFDFHPGEDGKMVLMCHDYVSALCGQDGGDKFLPFHLFDPNGYARVMNTVLDYTRYVRQKLEMKGDAADEQEKGKFDTELILRGPGGLPLLPKPCVGVKGHEIAELLKDVVREYFTTHYRLATGKSSARPPWKAIGENPRSFFKPECIPEGFVFQDPSRMGQNVKTLVDHLRKREEEFGVNAFCFERVQVVGFTELQPAAYPAEVEAVITAGKSVKTWPKAMDIPTNPRLKIVDEVDEHDRMDVDEGPSGLMSESTQLEEIVRDDVNGAEDQNPKGLTSTADEHRLPMSTARYLPNAEEVAGGRPDDLAVSLVELQQCPKTTSNPESHTELGVSGMSAGQIQPPSLVTMSSTKTLTQAYASPEPSISDFNKFPQMNQMPDAANQAPVHVPSYAGGPPYYFPIPPNIGGVHGLHSQMPSMMMNPFMGHMTPDQWTMLTAATGNHFFQSGNLSGSPSFGEPPKMVIDPSLLPPGIPPFSSPAHTSNFPQILSNRQVIPSFYPNSTPQVITRAPGIQPAELDSSSATMIAPKGTPSPKKSPNKKRGRNSEPNTPNRRRKTERVT